MKQDSNSQFERTDKAIIRAMCDLLDEKSFEQITIQNLLDETPVSRATFYKHFSDKYEVAERMMEIYMQMQEKLISSLATKPSYEYADAISSSIKKYKNLVHALLKIHTDKVDIREAVAERYRSYYLNNSTAATRELEADIYAHTMATYQLAHMEKPGNKRNLEYGRIMMEVFLTVIEFKNPGEVRTFLTKHLPK